MASSPDERPPPPSALDVAGAAVRVSEPGFLDGRLHWISTRPDGSGGAVLCSGSVGAPSRLESPPDVVLRSHLYLYGAGAWCPTALGPVGIEAHGQRLGLLSAAAFIPVGPPPQAGDALGDPTAVHGTSWVVAAMEDGGGAMATRGLVAVDLETGERTPLLVVAGRCAEPQVSPDAASIAWLEWPHGAMPWDAAEVRVAPLSVRRGAIACGTPRRVDGGRGASAGQPTWRPDGSLAYVTEAAGFWQPWVCDKGGVVRRLVARHAEFQRPRWLTCRWLAALGHDGALACAFADAEGEHVGVIGPDGALTALDQPCVRVDGVAADEATLGWVGATTSAQGAVWLATRADPGDASLSCRPVTQGSEAPGIPSVPERFSFCTGGVELDGVLWTPAGATGSAVPLVVAVHPGPTGAVDRSHTSIVHLLASHGFAVAAVDTSGSTAHGRAHRERLLGGFGVVDVAECAAAARHLVDAGVADRDALFIRGASAGGTTALLALESDVFRGAVAWYPASSFVDVDAGFEAGYLAALTGHHGADRSPLARAAQLRGSVLVIQGEDDPVVTPAETAALLDALTRALDDVTFVAVPGEGHGFRTTRGRATALDAELAFYQRLVALRPRADGAPSAPGTADRVAGAGAAGRYDASAGRSARPAPPEPP